MERNDLGMRNVRVFYQETLHDTAIKIISHGMFKDVRDVFDGV